MEVEGLRLHTVRLVTDRHAVRTDSKKASARSNHRRALSGTTDRRGDQKQPQMCAQSSNRDGATRKAKQVKCAHSQTTNTGRHTIRSQTHTVRQNTPQHHSRAGNMHTWPGRQHRQVRDAQVHTEATDTRQTRHSHRVTGRQRELAHSQTTNTDRDKMRPQTNTVRQNTHVGSWWGRQYTDTVRPLAQSDQRHTQGHRQALQVYDWAAAKCKYGIRSETCGTQEGKLNTRTSD